MSQSNQDQVAAASTSKNDQLDPTSPFYKVNVDCWEKIFDYFPLRDIINMSKTCRRMRQIGGFYFRENFPEVQCKWIDNRGIFVGYPSSVIGNDLCNFMTKVMVYGDLEHSLNSDTYSSLRTLVLRNIELSDIQIDHIKDVLSVVEKVDLRKCVINGDFFVKFYKNCPRLKQLILDELNFEPHTALDSFFVRQYPTLQQLEYIFTGFDPKNNELKTFLEKNSNIKQFGIDMHRLWVNKDSLLSSNVHLDCLSIHSTHEWLTPIPAAPMVELLQRLHDRGFYKTLHFTIIYADEECDYRELINEMAKLSALEGLTINQDIDLSHLIHLKKLCIWGEYFATNMETLAKNLMKLEKLFIYKATTDDILPFFRHSKRLNTVKVFKIYGPLLRDGALNLYALNLERNKLQTARKVFVCVDEALYLATKKKRMNLNLNRVDIARGESDELGDFDRNYYF